MDTHFEWDDRKATSNLTKHRVSFEEASTVFTNPLAALFDDEAHSTAELREVIIGHSAQGRLLVVIFTERAERVIRIISARQATKREQQDYEENIHL
jgi:uncharacterized DUF497 family protein